MSPSRRTRSVLLLAAGLCLALLAPSQALAAKALPDRPAVRAEVSLQVTGAWTGRVSFGTLTSGRTPTAQPLPLDLHLARTTCDVAGCWMTEILVLPTAGVPVASRISGRLARASVKRTTIAVIVRRSIHGRVVAEYASTVTMRVKVRRSGPVIRRTTLTQSPGAEVLTIARSAAASATVTMGDETLVATGEISRTRIVG